MPFFDYFDKAMDDFRENARQIFGCRGIFYLPLQCRAVQGMCVWPPTSLTGRQVLVDCTTLF